LLFEQEIREEVERIIDKLYSQKQLEEEKAKNFLEPGRDDFDTEIIKVTPIGRVEKRLKDTESRIRKAINLSHFLADLLSRVFADWVESRLKEWHSKGRPWINGIQARI